MSTPRQIEANRRNAQKSTGPRTEEGKNRSRFNGVTHGMTARFDVLPGEDARALPERIDAWTADLRPRNQLERDLIERAARVSWRLERVEKAHVARLTANILKATSGEEEAAVENDVLALGARLFQDLTKPHGFSPGIAGDPDSPALIVLGLESSAPGCRWLLDRWAELRALLEQEQPWQSPDKLRAIRLLGRQPLDALDDPQVAEVFVACHTIDPGGGELLHEIWDELGPEELPVARRRLARRPLGCLPLRDRTEAREALFQIVDRAVGPLETIAEAHRQRAERDAASAADRLAFDDSREGERLRNYELSCHRALMRIIDAICKARKAGTAGKLVAAAVAVESSTDPVATVDQRIIQTEPNSVSIANTETGSEVPDDHGIAQTEPNFLSITQTEPGSVAPVDHGIAQTEPNFLSIAKTEPESVVPADHGIAQTEPNFRIHCEDRARVCGSRRSRNRANRTQFRRLLAEPYRRGPPHPVPSSRAGRGRPRIPGEKPIGERRPVTRVKRSPSPRSGRGTG